MHIVSSRRAAIQTQTSDCLRIYTEYENVSPLSRDPHFIVSTQQMNGREPNKTFNYDTYHGIVLTNIHPYLHVYTSVFSREMHVISHPHCVHMFGKL